MPRHLEREILFRPSSDPSVQTPLGARSVGHYRVEPFRQDSIAFKHFVQVFWGVAGTGAIVIEGVEKRLKPDHVALYLPGMLHNVHALSEEWEYRWWTMDGPFALSMTAALGLSADTHYAGPAPIKLFAELTDAIGRPSRESELRASAIAYELLTLAARSGRKPSGDPRVGEAVAIIHDNWQDPALGVEVIALKLQIHRSSLCRAFHTQMGTSPIKYLANLRLQNALSMLNKSELSIAQIARKCGYRTPNYFARVMRDAYGRTPTEFRLDTL